MRIGKLEAKSKLNKKQGPQKICGGCVAPWTTERTDERQKPPKGDAIHHNLIQRSRDAIGYRQSRTQGLKARTTDDDTRNDEERVTSAPKHGKDNLFLHFFAAGRPLGWDHLAGARRPPTHTPGT